nr:steroid monooxygenase {N-terminal} [Rhodococcus rhodochrous, Peptide Partial, 15 aa] [Rhodococcus rhodochrous]
MNGQHPRVVVAAPDA